MNRNKKILRRRIVWVSCIAIIIMACLGLSLYLQPEPAIIREPVEDTRPLVKVANPKQKEISSRLIIPKIQVDSAILRVGLTETGNMDVPANIHKAGWYKYGAHPGAEGTAVIAGHLNGPQGKKGIFIDLDKLQVGDTIIVKNSSDRNMTFVVRSTRTYGQTERPSEVFTSKSGAHLNLITCTGVYDSGQNRYLDRLVVFADKVDS